MGTNPQAMGTTTALQGPLTGFTIGVTAARRRDELVALLSRRGARVVEAPALRIMPLEDDIALRRATEECLTAPLDYVVATTGVGWRGWMSAADGWGRGAALAEACRGAVVLTRGPKATGAVRASGLDEGFSPRSEATDELLTWLLARPLTGCRIAVQEHGVRLDAFAAALRERGAEVISVPVYHWAPPEDPAAVRRLVEQTVRREVHALTFTSAPAITAFLETAAADDLLQAALEALRADVLPVCVGPVCARPFTELGLPVVWPERGRLGALVRTLTEVLPARSRQELTLAGRTLVLQGNALLVDAESCWLSPKSAALLRALAERPGWVLSRAELLRRAWADSDADEHAVEAAVGRLRAALGPHGDLIRTVPKRGYRLAVG
ncbi:uroporphyrinogen-III synthase [Kitasatospora sp. MAP5-34]|uniref:uroporphyrinogen-III synthase n=1 Tax=Kitasatospora sp. MAP5-34 TaxID=3035102 RepID=UPI002476532B|nr:uroporphyrinogen-III synthase [Kitasatospora sp. MAP5-34]MDH6577535.1 uroporphyrinogen-III synthase [Kitasatospora sp. MAP5-34]